MMHYVTSRRERLSHWLDAGGGRCYIHSEAHVCNDHHYRRQAFDQVELVITDKLV
jgi:hypothetical protein